MMQTSGAPASSITLTPRLARRFHRQLCALRPQRQERSPTAARAQRDAVEHEARLRRSDKADDAHRQEPGPSPHSTSTSSSSAASCPPWPRPLHAPTSSSPAAAPPPSPSHSRGGVPPRDSSGTLLLGLAAAAAGAGVMGSGFSLEGPGSVAEAVGVLASIIAVHESGHFLAARALGIHVTKFSIGFGPALWQRKGESVEYSLRAIPLGGYVAFPDDDPASPFKADDPDLLKNRGLPQRCLVISAGVIANVLFALAVLFTQVETVGRAESAYLPGVRVPEVMAAGAAQRAGLLPGDVILRVGDYEVPASSGQVTELVRRIKASPQRELQLSVERGGRRLTLPVTPQPNADGQGAIGVSLLSNTFIKHIKAAGTVDALRMSWGEFVRLGTTVLTGLQSIFTNFTAVSKQLSGPVAIVAAGSEIARTDAAGLYQFCAIVNINLAAVNLLPLPALDGGYLALLLLEGLRGRKLPAGVEQGVMSSGLLVLTAIGLGLVVRDTLNLL